MSMLGILFDSEKLGDIFYGSVAYQIFFDALDTRQLAGCTLYSGDIINATIQGNVTVATLLMRLYKEMQTCTVLPLLQQMRQKLIYCGTHFGHIVQKGCFHFQCVSLKTTRYVKNRSSHMD